MSSPLSSLKKGARHYNFLPGHIPGHRPIPFRHPEYSEDESKLLEEITTSMAAQRMHTRDPVISGLPEMVDSPNPSLVRSSNSDDPQAGTSSDSEHSVPSDRELMKLMMARLAIMEQKVQQQERDITDRDRRIKVLEDKLRILNAVRSEEAAADSGDENQNNKEDHKARVKDLEKHCLVLQQQIHEMETFLADYGMVWVGDDDEPDIETYIKDSPDDSDDKRAKGSKGAGSSGLDDWSLPPSQTRGKPFKLDFDLILANIRDLNVIAGEGESHVRRTADGARLVKTEPIPLTFYSNGIIMFQGPFRPYTEPRTVECMQDFMDGYFPSELQHQYPDGVPFSVRDMRDVYFQPAKASNVFAGTGQTLGGEEQPSRLIPHPLKPDDEPRARPGNANINMTSEPPHRQLTQEQFLNKLPKSVVKDGKVIDIRDSVGRTLTGQCSSSEGQDKLHITVVETSVTKAIQKTMAQAKAERPKTPRDITTLRVKSESGSDTYILKMRFQETVGDLRKYLNKHRARQSTAYEIYSTYPRKQFSDDSATLEACGLIPNGVLYLRPETKS